MPEEFDQREIEELAVAAFGVFDNSPEGWPDKIEFNRSGYTDVNIRGIWSFEERVDFVNVPLLQQNLFRRDENAITPESSGSPE